MYIIKMFSVTAKQLQAMRTDSNTKEFQIGVVAYRIIYEVLNMAPIGKQSYTCDIMAEDAPEVMKLILTYIQGCSITIVPQRMDMVTLTIDWS